MASCRNVSVGIPRDGVRGTLHDVQVAVRASPNFVVVCLRTGCGLNNKLNAILDFCALDASSHRIEI